MNDNEAFKRWTIGAARITRVLELPPLTADPAIFIQTTKDEIVKRSDWLCPDYADTDGNITLHFQAFIIEASGKRILVDPCIGNGKERDIPAFNKLKGPFLKRLEAAGLPLARIAYFLCPPLPLHPSGAYTNPLD